MATSQEVRSSRTPVPPEVQSTLVATLQRASSGHTSAVPSTAHVETTDEHMVSRGLDHGHQEMESSMTWEEFLSKDCLVIGDPDTGVVVSSLRWLLALKQQEFFTLLPQGLATESNRGRDMHCHARLASMQDSVSRNNLRDLFPDFPTTLTDMFGGSDTLVVPWTENRLSGIPREFWRLVSPTFDENINRAATMAYPIVRLSDVLRSIGVRVYASATQAAGLTALSIMPVAIVGDLCDAMSTASLEALAFLLGDRKEMAPRLGDTAADMAKLLEFEQASRTHIFSTSPDLSAARDMLATVIPVDRGLPILSAMTKAFLSSPAEFPLGQLEERMDLGGRYPFPSVPRRKEDLVVQGYHATHQQLSHAYSKVVKVVFLPSMWKREGALTRLPATRGRVLFGEADKPSLMHGMRIASAVYLGSSAAESRLIRVWPGLGERLFDGPIDLDRKTVAAILGLPKVGGSHDPFGDLELLKQDARFYFFFIALMKEECAHRRSPFSYGMEEFIDWVARGASAPFRGRLGDPATHCRPPSSAADSSPHNPFVRRDSSHSAIGPSRTSETASREARSGRTESRPLATTSSEVRSGRDGPGTTGRSTGRASASSWSRRTSPTRHQLRSRSRSSGRERRRRRSRSHASTRSRSRTSRRSRSRSARRRTQRSRSRSRSGSRRARALFHHREPCRSKESHRSTSRRRRSRSPRERSTEPLEATPQGVRSSQRPTGSTSEEVRTSSTPLTGPETLVATSREVSSGPTPATLVASSQGDSSGRTSVETSSALQLNLLADIAKLQEEVARLKRAGSSPPDRRIQFETKDESDPDDESHASGEDLEIEVQESDSEEEPILSRSAPPLSKEVLDELILGRVGVFVGDAEDLRNKLYIKKWKVPASLLVQAKDQPAPKEQHWNLPGKESSSLKLATDFNQAEGIIIHSRHSLSFGSETVAAQLKESPLLTKEEQEYLKTGLDKELARDTELLWRAVRLHQEAALTESKVSEMARCLKEVQQHYPEVWKKIRQDHDAAHPDEPWEHGTTLPVQQAARTRIIAGSTVALFMETLKQGYRQAHLYATKALGISPAVLGSSAPRHDVQVIDQAMVAEAQASAALPLFAPLSNQRRSQEPGPKKRKNRAARTRERKRAGTPGTHFQFAQPPKYQDPQADQPDRHVGGQQQKNAPGGGKQKHRQPTTPKQKNAPGGGQQKRQKRE